MKTTIALLALFVFVLVGGYWWSHHQTEETIETAQTATTTASTTPMEEQEEKPAATDTTTTQPVTKPAGTYTLADVAAHNTSKSCWSAINGAVYDLTSWISQHPGGAARILGICGKDGSSAFDGQHGEDQRAMSVLVNFKLGTLAQ